MPDELVAFPVPAKTLFPLFTSELTVLLFKDV
jgi:hypothetical protein